MIYEKRQTGIDVRKEKVPVRRVNNAVKGGICNALPPRKREYVVRPGFVVARRVIRRRRLRRILRGAAVFFAAFGICLFALDARLFQGRMREGLGEALRDGARDRLEEATDELLLQKNTLYTRLLYDKTAEIVPAAKEEGAEEREIYIPEKEDGEGGAATVSGAVSQSYVDGTVYYPITSLDLAAESIYALSNGTSLSPDTQGLSLLKPRALEGIEKNDAPLVLIIHTHGEECYTEYTDMYPKDEATRCVDTDKNVVRVGKEISDTLSDYGINALHCTKMHDSESFINAYSASAATVRKYLEEYPSIRFVIDVHRDAIIRDDGESIKVVTNIAGQDYAQIMFVVGTNELGHNHPTWEDNLSLALFLQKSIEDTYPSLCRSINLRNVPFNQQLSSGYLLLEVGTSANTLDEALRSARAFGENLARAVFLSETD